MMPQDATGHYRELLERMPDAVIVCQDEKIVYCNSAALRLYKAACLEHLQSKAPLELLHPGERRKVKAKARKVHSGETMSCTGCRHKRLDGIQFLVEMTAASIIWKGKPSIQVIVREASQQKTQQALTTGVLRILNRDTHDISESIREVLTLIQESTGFDAVGLRLRHGDDYPYFEQKGFSKEFILLENQLCSRSGDGQPLLGEDGKPVLECTCGLILSGRTDPDLPFFTSNGSFWTNKASDFLSIPVEDELRTSPRNNCISQGYQSVALVPVRSGREIIGLLQLNGREEGKLTLDMVHYLEGLGDQLGLALKRMQVQEELRSLNELLEHKVAARTAEVEQRSEQLRLLALELTVAEDRERKRLAQKLHDGLQQILAGARYQLATIERNADRKDAVAEVASMIDEAIKTSRSLTAELSPPILHQSGLIAGLKWLAQWMHDKYGFDVRLEINDENSRLSDKVSTFLFHAIRELLSNVRKHAGVKSAGITISNHDESVWITVADEGCGFDTNQIRSGGGTAGGFGLFILSERLSMLGGRMTVESAPGAGSRITLVLPQTLASDPGSDLASSRASQARRLRSRQASSTGKAKKKIRVLLVDDHAVVRHGLAVMLQEHEQLEVAGEAADGESAIEMVRKLHPDVVLMDISMPGMNGIQATRIIHSEFPEISVIGLSMFQEKEQAAAMMDAGAVNYLSKSGPPDDVIAAIKACAGKRR